MKKVLIFVLLAATLLTALTVFPLATSEDSELLSPGEGAAALDGKKIIFVANLAPAKLCGEESQGMLLACDAGDDVRVVFIDGDIPNGSTVR